MTGAVSVAERSATGAKVPALDDDAIFAYKKAAQDVAERLRGCVGYWQHKCKLVVVLPLIRVTERDGGKVGASVPCYEYVCVEVHKDAEEKVRTALHGLIAHGSVESVLDWDQHANRLCIKIAKEGKKERIQKPDNRISTRLYAVKLKLD